MQKEILYKAGLPDTLDVIGLVFICSINDSAFPKEIVGRIDGLCVYEGEGVGIISSALQPLRLGTDVTLSFWEGGGWRVVERVIDEGGRHYDPNAGRCTTVHMEFLGR